MPEVRVHDLAISLDGYAAGPDQSLDLPLGVGGERLHEWTVATRSFRRIDGTERGDERLFDHLDGDPHGYECVELVSSPSVAQARIRRATR